MKVITLVLVLCSSAVIAQNYNMEIEQGTASVFAPTTSIQKISFRNNTTTPFVCGEVILYGGETYQTVLLGSECWFQKNLNIGTRINGTTNQTNNSIIEKYCYDDVEANCTTYGGLYQWDEAMQYVVTEGAQGICPEGWHIATYPELQNLNSDVSGSSNALKTKGQGTGSGVGTNTSGYSALLSGSRDYYDYDFNNAGLGSYLWSSKVYNSSSAWFMALLFDNDDVYIDPNATKSYGLSVRCVKD